MSQDQPQPKQGVPASAQNPTESPGALRPPGSLALWTIPDPADPRLLPPWFRRAVVMVIILVIVSQAALWGFSRLTSFWFTIFFAFFLGLAMEPVVNRLAERGIKRGLGTFIVMGGLIGGTVIFFWIFGAGNH